MVLFLLNRVPPFPLVKSFLSSLSSYAAQLQLLLSAPINTLQNRFHSKVAFISLYVAQRLVLKCSYMIYDGFCPFFERSYKKHYLFPSPVVYRLSWNLLVIRLVILLSLKAMLWNQFRLLRLNHVSHLPLRAHCMHPRANCVLIAC